MLSLRFAQSIAITCYPLLFQTSASLKFTVLNPKGRIWTMVAGGGASVIYADTVSLASFSSFYFTNNQRHYLLLYILLIFFFFLPGQLQIQLLKFELDFNRSARPQNLQFCPLTSSDVKNVGPANLSLSIIVSVRSHDNI